MELDFSGLTNDQLIALIRAACAEARNRGAATETAARGVYLDEVERARIIAAATAEETDRLRAIEADRVAREAAAKVRRDAEQNARDEAHAKEAASWARKKGVALAVKALFGERAVELKVWNKQGARPEKRVYVNGLKGYEVACLYATGNAYMPPGKLTIYREFEHREPEIRRLLETIARVWSSLSFDVDEAAAWRGEAIPVPGYESPKEMP